jgi:hypothetical protein
MAEASGGERRRAKMNSNKNTFKWLSAAFLIQAVASVAKVDLRRYRKEQ